MMPIMKSLAGATAAALLLLGGNATGGFQSTGNVGGQSQATKAYSVAGGLAPTQLALKA